MRPWGVERVAARSTDLLTSQEGLAAFPLVSYFSDFRQT